MISLSFAPSTLSKEAIGPKGKLGVLVGIEDNMPAYRVLDLERGAIKKIPFSQLITHEGHYPFKSYAHWTEAERELPESFIPTLESYQDSAEWRRFQFQANDLDELKLNPMPGPSASSGLDAAEVCPSEGQMRH